MGLIATANPEHAKILCNWNDSRVVPSVVSMEHRCDILLSVVASATLLLTERVSETSATCQWKSQSRKARRLADGSCQSCKAF